MVTFTQTRHFSESLQGVYNPFSVISALKERRLRPYWIASGATEMLPKILTNFEKDVETLDGSLIDMDYIETADISKDNPKLFLYQSGYLTIKGVIGETYRLGFPNREVKKALLELVVPNMLNANKEETEIASRHYADAYAASKKKLISLALVFDKENRGLIDWQKAD